MTWKKLPDDFVLDDEPVNDVNQFAIAAALTKSLELASRFPLPLERLPRGSDRIYCQQIMGMEPEM